MDTKALPMSIGWGVGFDFLSKESIVIHFSFLSINHSFHSFTENVLPGSFDTYEGNLELAHWYCYQA